MLQSAKRCARGVSLIIGGLMMGSVDVEPFLIFVFKNENIKINIVNLHTIYNFTKDKNENSRHSDKSS